MLDGLVSWLEANTWFLYIVGIIMWALAIGAWALYFKKKRELCVSSSEGGAEDRESYRGLCPK